MAIDVSECIDRNWILECYELTLTNRIVDGIIPDRSVNRLHKIQYIVSMVVLGDIVGLVMIL